MMKKEFHTPEGVETKELTSEEIEKYANEGDTEAKKEILKQEVKSAKTIEERVSAIEKYLMVE